MSEKGKPRELQPTPQHQWVHSHQGQLALQVSPLQLWLPLPSLRVLCPLPKAHWQPSSQGLFSQAPLWLLSWQGGCCQGMRGGPEWKQLWLSQEARRMLVGVCQANEAWTWMEAWTTNDKDNGCVRISLPEPRTPTSGKLHRCLGVSIVLYVVKAEKEPLIFRPISKLHFPFLQGACYSSSQRWTMWERETLRTKANSPMWTPPPASIIALTKGGLELVILLWD